MEILEELEKMPHVKGNQPRKVIDLIQSVEKADLTELRNSGAIKNPLVIKSIESKLPDFIKRDWSQVQKLTQPSYSRRMWLRPNLQLLVTVSSLSGGTGTASELHVSQDVEDADVETVHQEEKK